LAVQVVDRPPKAWSARRIVINEDRLTDLDLIRVVRQLSPAAAAIAELDLDADIF
jgi:hypothetical protein